MSESNKPIINAIMKHELAVIGTMVTFFTWIVVMIFSLSERQAIAAVRVESNFERLDTRQDRMADKINKIYDLLLDRNKEK